MVHSVESPPRFHRVDELVEQFVTSGPILDVGCGDGRMVARFRAAGFECTGLDIDADVLKVARQLYGDDGWVHADGQSLPFGADTFGSVISLYFAANLMDRDRFVAEAARVLRPGGKLVYTLVNPPVRAAEAVLGRLRLGRRLGIRALSRHMRWLGDPAQEWRHLQRHGLAPEILVGPIWMPVVRRVPSWWKCAPLVSGKAVCLATDVVVRAHKPSRRADAKLTSGEHALVLRIQTSSQHVVAGWTRADGQALTDGVYLVATSRGLMRVRWLGRVSLQPIDAHWFQPESGAPIVLMPDAIIGRAVVSGRTDTQSVV